MLKKGHFLGSSKKAQKTRKIAVFGLFWILPCAPLSFSKNPIFGQNFDRAHIETQTRKSAKIAKNRPFLGPPKTPFFRLFLITFNTRCVGLHYYHYVFVNANFFPSSQYFLIEWYKKQSIFDVSFFILLLWTLRVPPNRPRSIR